MLHKIKLAIITLLFSLNAFCFCAERKNITIFVHGTRRVTKLFFRYIDENNKIKPVKDLPENCITHYFAKALSSGDPKNYSIENFYVFGWSGALSNKARFDDAKILFDEISRFVEALRSENVNFSINIITHSHGGNVALNLANHAKENGAKFKIEKLILLACPIQEQTCQLVNHEIFKNVYNIYSTSDLIQIIDPQGLHSENKGKNVPFFSARKFQKCSKVKQCEVTIDDYGVSHAGFLSKKFFKRLPKLLRRMDQIPNPQINL